MAPRGPVSRAEFERLRAECRQLRADLEEVRKRAREQSAALRVQFTRIAEMQAILDEERAANAREPLSTPRPLLPNRH